MLGAKQDYVVSPSSEEYMDYIRTEYASLISLKNNWRGQNITEVKQFYKELIMQIQVYIQYIQTNKINLTCVLQYHDTTSSIQGLYQLYFDSLSTLRIALERG